MHFFWSQLYFQALAGGLVLKFGKKMCNLKEEKCIVVIINLYYTLFFYTTNFVSLCVVSVIWYFPGQHIVCAEIAEVLQLCKTIFFVLPLKIILVLEKFIWWAIPFLCCLLSFVLLSIHLAWTSIDNSFYLYVAIWRWMAKSSTEKMNYVMKMLTVCISNVPYRSVFLYCRLYTLLFLSAF